MAGSYNHVVADNGNLGSNSHVVAMLENGGDVFEAVEEMYGMIWWLASEGVNMSQLEDLSVEGPDNPERLRRMKEWVEKARQNYKEGLEFSKEIHRQFPDQRRD